MDTNKPAVILPQSEFLQIIRTEQNKLLANQKFDSPLLP